MTQQKATAPVEETFAPAPVNVTAEISTVNQMTNEVSTEPVATEPLPPEKPALVPPVDQADKRVTKKPFGIYITRATSPVQPERFSGYHTGADFEMLSEEEYGADTHINAVCEGSLLRKQTADGYGGYAVQQCSIDGEAITVVYGHLDISRITEETQLSAGDFLGYLGAHESSQTDGERKHLHLSFHKGTDINIRGYVSAESGLAEWIDPCDYIC